jgi:hypothetical protein
MTANDGHDDRASDGAVAPDEVLKLVDDLFDHALDEVGVRAHPLEEIRRLRQARAVGIRRIGEAVAGELEPWRLDQWIEWLDNLATPLPAPRRLVGSGIHASGHVPSPRHPGKVLGEVRVRCDVDGDLEEAVGWRILPQWEQRRLFPPKVKVTAQVGDLGLDILPRRQAPLLV